MKYDSFSYLYPPRPEKPVPNAMLSYYERRGWVAQIKKNGDCTVIFTNGKDVIFKTRHEDDFKRWSPTSEIVSFFSNATKGAWDVYVAELLHNKTPKIKNTLYVFDKIVHQGNHLVGVSFEERQQILQCQWSGSTEEHYIRITNNIVVARNFTSWFVRMYDEIVSHDITENPQDEGLVLKNPKATLKPCFRENANGSWMVKVRRPHKNYSF